MGCLFSLFKVKNLHETQQLTLDYESDTDHYDELNRPVFFTENLLKRYYYQFCD